MNESPDYIKFIHEKKYSQETVVINWCFINTCNYKCSYCVPTLNMGSNEMPKFKEITKFVDYILSHFNDKKIVFELTGGEITLWKKLIKFADYLHKHNIKISIISNASKDIKWWRKNIEKFDFVNLSYHVEYAHPDNFIKITDLLSLNTNLHVNIMMHPFYWGQCIEVAKQIAKIKNLTISLQPLLKGFDTELYKYKPSQLEIINNQYNDFTFKSEQITDNYKKRYRGIMKKIYKDNHEENIASHVLISRKENSWPGWKCYIGIEQIVIDPFGDIYRGWCKVGGKIGNVFSQNIDFPENPVICNSQYCLCNLDISTTKEYQD